MVPSREPPAPAQRVELNFLERLNQRRPNRPEILQALADLYTRCGLYAEGLQVDLVLQRLCPRDNLVAYNLACSYSLLERIPEALDTLERAVSLGYAEYGWMMQDEDLDNLRNEPRFTALLEKLAALHPPLP